MAIKASLNESQGHLGKSGSALTVSKDDSKLPPAPPAPKSEEPFLLDLLSGERAIKQSRASAASIKNNAMGSLCSKANDIA